MPKVISRATVAASKEQSDETHGYERLFCLCAEFILVIAGLRLQELPQRPLDGAHALRNSGPSKTSYKLNATAETNESGGPGGVLVRHDQGIEFRRRLLCPRCKLAIGYETEPGSQRGEATFIMKGALSSRQGYVPPE